MHAYFEVLAAAVKKKPLPKTARSGSILFRVLGLEPETFRVELAAAGCTTSTADSPADLTVWASRAALDGMLEGRGSESLRVDGDAGLLDSLASLAAPGLSPLAIRLGRTS